MIDSLFRRLAVLVCVLAARADAQTTTTVFAGFEPQPVGQATLTVPPAFDRLIVDGLEASGGVTFVLDAEAGTIVFGDGVRGARPSSGSSTVRGEYRSGAGESPAVVASAGQPDPVLTFDFAPVGTNAVKGTFRVAGTVVVDELFPIVVAVRVEQWPDEKEIGIEDGEVVTSVRWNVPILVVLPDQRVISCDEITVTSQLGGALAGEQIGTMIWEGSGLDRVEILGARFREADVWTQIEGDLLLSRGLLGHELTHVVQQGPGGSASTFPLDPSGGGTTARGTYGREVAALFASPPEIGTRFDFDAWVTLQDGSRARVPSHIAEWVDTNDGEPGMSLRGGFVELGASTYTVQVFDDGVLVDTATGLAAEVVRVKEFAMQHNQTAFDFVHQRASAQMDLGRDVEITLLTPSPRTVRGDRVHIVPEQLQVVPESVEGVAVGLRRVANVTLKRGVIDAPLPPATAFGLTHTATGDALLTLENGALVARNTAWGPLAPGPLVGGVRTRFAGLEGLRWRSANLLDPTRLPNAWRRSLLLDLIDADGEPASAGLDVEASNGHFAIGVDFLALGSPDAELRVWSGDQPVHEGILTQQGRVLVDTDWNEVEVLEDADGIVTFTLRWDLPQDLTVDGEEVSGDRVSARLRHRDRAVTVEDFGTVAAEDPGVAIGRASVKPADAWTSAVGEVSFGDPTADPLLVEHLDPFVPTGIEVDSQDDPRGNAYVLLEVADPSLRNALQGLEEIRLVVQDDDEDGNARVASPGMIVLERANHRWSTSVDFAAAGYTGFRVEADGVGTVTTSSSPTGVAFWSANWPTTHFVQGVGDELIVRLVFDDPATVAFPQGGTVTTDAITIVLVGGSGFGSGDVRLLAQGLRWTELPRSQVAVDVPRDDFGPGTRAAVVLRPPWPNPFNPRTSIRLTVSSASETSVRVLDARGRHVRTVHEGPLTAGEHVFAWTGLDDDGRRVGSGVYFVHAAAGAIRATRKMVLVQ